MALTTNQILRLTEPLELMYMNCSSQLLINLCGHFATGKGLATAEWEIQKLSELDALTAESVEIIANTTGRSPQAIRTAIAKALEIELSDVESVLQKAAKAGAIQGVKGSWNASPRIQEVLKNLVGQAVNDANIVNTVMLSSTLNRYTQAISSTVSYEKELIEKLYSATDYNAGGHDFICD